MNTRLSRTKRVAREVGGGVRRAACLRSRALLALALAGFALTSGAARLDAQVYGVARRTTVVAAGRPALPPGYFWVLPHGYQVVVVRGSRYYLADGIYYQASFYRGRVIYYRPTFYQGRTVYNRNSL